MAKQQEGQLSRFDILYWEGINALVSHNVAKKQELSEAINCRSNKIGVLEKRQGYRRLGSELGSTAEYGLFFFAEEANASSKKFYRVSKVGGVVSIYYLNTSDVWTALSGGGTALSSVPCYITTAEGCMFVVNGTDDNRYVSNDGTTVVTSTTASGHLFGSPDAKLINYYKDRLYLGDYTNTTRYRNGVMMSSVPLGIVALVDGDHAQPVTSLKVTDIKYIQASDSLDLYRGGTKIGDITVTAKNTDTNTLTISSFATDIKSSDELWVDGTYTGAKVFRWADNPQSGIDVKQYDTFKIAGGDNDGLTMMRNVGDVMIIANKSNLAVWNNFNLQNFDLGIGCCSKRGHVKTLGTLYFIDYSGIWSTTGDVPQLISAKMEPYFSGATKTGLEAGAMGKKGFSIFAAIGDVTLYNPDGSTNRTLTNVVLEYNLRQKNWFVHTGIDADEFHTYKTSDNADRLQFVGTSGEVFELFYGTEDNNTTEIPFQIITNNLALGSNEFETIVYPKKIILETERGSDIRCFLSLDNNAFYELKGNAVKGCTIFDINQDAQGQEARCRKIRISIREISSRLCSISKLSILYSLTAEEEKSHS